MKIIYNNYIPFKGFRAINICGVLYIRNEYKGKITQKTLNHEAIHTAQMKELLYVFFYILYLVNWILTFFSYSSISFEREAYFYQNNNNYLKSRSKYHWIKFII